jgi:hypothetical protein
VFSVSSVSDNGGNLLADNTTRHNTTTSKEAKETPNEQDHSLARHEEYKEKHLLF